MAKETTTIKDWKEIPFSDSFQRIKVGREKQVKERDYLKTGSFPVIDQGQSFIAGYTNEKNKIISDIQPLIIFGDHTRILKYIDFPIALGADGTKVIKPTNDFDAKFFYYFLNHLNIPSRGYNRHFSLLKEKNILQPNLPEQKSIARVLTIMQDSISGQEELIAKLKELKRGMMQYLFTHGTKGEKTKITELGEMPKSWNVVELGSICRNKIVDGVHKTPKYIPAGIPFITAKDIDDGRVIFDKCRFISEEEHKNLSKRVPLEQNDILMTKVGSVGKLAMVGRDENYSIFVQVALIKPNEKINNKFLFYFLQWDRMQRKIIESCAQSTMKFIGTQKIAKLPIFLPEIKTQEQIAETISSIDFKREVVQEKLLAYQNLFKTLLHELMSGERRVKLSNNNL